MANRSLHREQTVVSNMARGLEIELAAAYMHRQLNKAASEEDAALHRQIHEDIKEIMSVNGESGFPTLPAWDPSASTGSGLPEQTHRQHVRADQCEGASLQIRIRQAGVTPRNTASVRHEDYRPTIRLGRAQTQECYKCRQRGRG